MNYIISSYLTTNIDQQRGLYQQKDDPDYISIWYESLVKLGLNGIIIFDDLSENFMRKYPLMQFIRIEAFSKIQLHDFRWLNYLNILERQPVENVFFTDLQDVEIIKNPFIQPEFNDHTLFCGDEQKDMNCYIVNIVSDQIRILPGYQELINSNRTLLNCGIVGGSRQVIYEFLCKMRFVIYRVINRPPDATVDMPIFNYVVYQFFPDLLHGFPVNSIFKNYEKRNDVWFIHK
jgi:hypothetical protein